MDGAQTPEQAEPDAHGPRCVCETCFGIAQGKYLDALSWALLCQEAEEEALAPELTGIMRQVLELGKQMGRKELLNELRRPDR